MRAGGANNCAERSIIFLCVVSVNKRPVERDQQKRCASGWTWGDDKILLARDKTGEKPLYYGLVNSNFVFGSELKAVKAFPQFDNQVNRSALAEYLRYGYIPSPLSIYDGINKLQPGHIIEIEIHDNQFSIKKPKKYWGLENV